MQADLGLHLDDAGGDLDEAQTQGVELGDSKARSLGHGGAQPPHQPLCSGVQEGAELVCRRSRARGTVSGEVGFPGLDMVRSHLAPTVDVLVERHRPAAFEVGDDEASVGACGPTSTRAMMRSVRLQPGGPVEELLEAPDLANEPSFTRLGFLRRRRQARGRADLDGRHLPAQGRCRRNAEDEVDAVGTATSRSPAGPQ